MILKEMQEKYMSLLHAMQTGVMWKMKFDHKEGDPKHLRTGINSALINQGAVASLLIKKGIFTEEEYMSELIEFADRDVKSYEAEINNNFHAGKRITLG